MTAWRALALPLLLTLAVASCRTGARRLQASDASTVSAAELDAVGVMRSLGAALREDYGASVIVDRALGHSATAECVTNRAVRCVTHGPALLEAVVAGTPPYTTADSARLCPPSPTRCAPGTAAYFVTVGGPVFSSDTVAHVDVKVRRLEGAGPMANVSWIRHSFVRQGTAWRRTGRETMIAG